MSHATVSAFARLAGIILLVMLLLDILRLLPSAEVVGWVAFPLAAFIVLAPLMRR